VALGDNGKPSFQLLQATLKEQKGANLAFYAFDLLVDRGEDITQAAQHRAQGAARGFAQRRQPPILYGDHVIAKGEALFDAICKEGGEGIISKKAERPTRHAHAATGSRSNASSARNSSSSAGRRATSAAASARCTWPSATAAS
jgi:ATP-dependent DNA ligase